MPQIESVLTATQSEADADDSQLSPTQTQDTAVVHVTLRFDGVDFDPSDLYDMLNTQYGTVNTDHANTRNSFIFNIRT